MEYGDFGTSPFLRQLSGKFLLDPWQQLARFKIHRQSVLWREEIRVFIA
jgi:hypothetical protein